MVMKIQYHKKLLKTGFPPWSLFMTYPLTRSLYEVYEMRVKRGVPGRPSAISETAGQSGTSLIFLEQRIVHKLAT